MKNWLRIIVPDLLLASVVALVVTLAVNYFDGAEVRRMRTDDVAAAQNGLTLDERIDTVGASIRRSTLFHLPALIALSGAVIGLACRNRRWAWLTAIASVLPAVIMGIAFFVDQPLPASALAITYTGLAVAMVSAGSALRDRLFPELARTRV